MNHTKGFVRHRAINIQKYKNNIAINKPREIIRAVAWDIILAILLYTINVLK